jgi:acyl carrier protein phosphodiesterase
MNFLAHLFVTRFNDDWMMGNMIADFIKKNEEKNFSEAIQKGIKVHRMIDTFTDSHPVIREGSHRIMPHFHKYSPVIVDIYYDYLLSKNWRHVSDESLEDFSKRVYTMFQERMHEMPERLQKYLPNMIEHDWLNNYGTKPGLVFTFQKFEKRLSFDMPLDTAPEVLIENIEHFEKDFKAFFPELMTFVKNIEL